MVIIFRHDPLKISWKACLVLNKYLDEIENRFKFDLRANLESIPKQKNKQYFSSLFPNIFPMSTINFQSGVPRNYNLCTRDITNHSNETLQKY